MESIKGRSLEFGGEKNGKITREGNFHINESEKEQDEHLFVTTIFINVAEKEDNKDELYSKPISLLTFFK